MAQKNETSRFVILGEVKLQVKGLPARCQSTPRPGHQGQPSTLVAGCASPLALCKVLRKQLADCVPCPVGEVSPKVLDSASVSGVDSVSPPLFHFLKESPWLFTLLFLGFTWVTCRREMGGGERETAQGGERGAIQHQLSHAAKASLLLSSGAVS